MTQGQNYLPSGFSQSWTQLAAQDWHEACLYVVATPIGNLFDISLRALYALQICDVIACEDTRATQVLLKAWGIHKPLIALHRHNEAQAAEGIIQRLANQERVALVSDAGSPAISDPGGKLVEKVHQANFRVSPIAGACAVTTCLMATGFTHDENPSFAFAGFVPSKQTARLTWLQQWAKQPMTVLMYEAPHRIQALAQALQQVCDHDRLLAIGRELSKKYEQIVVLRVGELVDWFERNPMHLKGEFVIALSAEKSEQANEHELLRPLVEQLLEQQLSSKDISRIPANALGMSKELAYRLALSLKEEKSSGRAN